MKDTRDLVASAEQVLARYKAGRFDRETVQEWVRRLGTYGEPHASSIDAAREWFRARHADLKPEALVARDIEMLEAIGAARL